MKIAVLSDRVVNQIAAGEIIDRPASVVRELVDNAIDAGANEITVTLESGGRNLIRIADDGCGMVRDDALLAFERHATSKLRELGDLDRIATMGFRGEALPSIAAVSRVTLITRSSEGGAAAAASLGSEIQLEGGVLKQVRETPAAQGTVIEIRQLFYNAPVRRKFLREPHNEEQRVKQWVVQSSIGNPRVRYRLIADQRELINLPRRENLFERGETLVRGTSVRVDTEREGIVMQGVLGHPALAQCDSSSFILILNRRVISDRALLRAVRDGFDATLKDREFPVGFLSLTIDPRAVDVNVHPQKSEVRFRSPQQVFVTVRDAVLAAVQEFKAPLPGSDWRIVQGGRRPGRASLDHRTAAATTPAAQSVAPSGLAASSAPPQQARFALATEGRAAMLFGMPASGTIVGNMAAAAVAAPMNQSALDRALTGSSAVRLVDGSELADTAASFRFSDLRYIGQLFHCYLLCELNESFYVVDMHAAHERLNYNLIRPRVGRSVESQQLLVPLTVELGERGAENCELHADSLREVGLEIERFGASAVLVRGVPAMLVGCDLGALVKEIAVEEIGGAAAGRFKERLDHIAARIACHASIRAGRDLDREEAYALLAAMDQCEFSAACPHGRPIVVQFTQGEIEQWFGRDR